MSISYKICKKNIVQMQILNECVNEGSSHAARPTARIGNTSDGEQDMQFMVIVFTIFCALHPSTLCNRSPKHSFCFQGPAPLTLVCGGSLSNMDRPLSGWGYVLILGSNSTIC